MPAEQGDDNLQEFYENSICARFQPLAKLGSGGMGLVYLARDRITERELALKISRADDPLAAEALEQEFVALSEIRHSGVPAPNDFGAWDFSGRRYLATEFIRGQGLLEWGEGFDSEALFGVTASLLRILASVHAQGWVHFDVKAENIRVRPLPQSGGELACLLDFGLAARIRDKRLRSARGTLHSIAPELISEAPWDHRVDLYSLGVSLYRVASGRLPFEADDARKTLKKVLEGEAEPCSMWRPEIPQALCQLIQGLMARRPEDRYASAAEALAALATMRAESQPEWPSGPLRCPWVGPAALIDDGLRVLDSGSSLAIVSKERGAGATRFVEELAQASRRRGRPCIDLTSQELESVWERRSELAEIFDSARLFSRSPIAFEGPGFLDLMRACQSLVFIASEEQAARLCQQVEERADPRFTLTPLELPALAPVHCEDLLRSFLGLDDLPAELAEIAGRACRGRPGEVEDLASALLSAELVRPFQGFVDLAASRALIASWPMLRGFGSEGLEPQDWEALCALSALPLEPAGLRSEMLGLLNSPDFRAAAEKLIGMGLLQGDSSAPSFKAPALQGVLRQLAPKSAWRSWHARAAAAIAGDREDLARLQWRARCEQESGAFPSASAWRRIAQVASKAGDRGAALAALEKALAAAAPDSTEHRDIALELAEQLADEGRLSRAASVLAWSLKEPQGGVAGARLLQASIEASRARFEAARAAYSEVLSLEPDSQERAQAFLGLSRVALQRGDYWSAIALADEVERGPPSDEHRVSAAWIRGLADYYLGETERASPRLALALRARLASVTAEPLIELRERLDSKSLLQSPFSDSFGLISLSSPGEALAIFTGQLPIAREQAARAAAQARAQRAPAALALALSNHAVYARLAGELGLALRECREALAIYEGLDDLHGATMSLNNLAGLYAVMGQQRACERAAEQVWARARQAGLSWLQGHASVLLARAGQLAGELELSERSLQRAEGAFAMIHNRRNQCAAIIARAELAIERGRGAEARTLLARAKQIAPKPEPLDIHIQRQMLLAQLELADAPEEAARMFEDALLELDATPICELELRLRRRLAAAYRAMGSSWLAREQGERIDELQGRFQLDLHGGRQGPDVPRPKQ